MIVENKSNKVKILKEEKKVLDSRFNFLTNETGAPKYYFADSNDNKISDSYYSINPLRDGIHYIVSELDFMYSDGLDEWNRWNMHESRDSITYFRFHYGVVSVIDGKITKIVPIIYSQIRETNSNMILVYCDKKYELNKTKVMIDEIPEKIGCINLEIGSESYGMSVIPPIMDNISDFDLDYNGFAYASIGQWEGYFSKDISFDRYTELINALLKLENGDITIQEYYSTLPENVSKIFFTDDDIKKIGEGQKNKSLK